MDPFAFWQLTTTGRADAAENLWLAAVLFLPFLVPNLMFTQRVVNKPYFALGISLYAYAAVVPYMFASGFYFNGTDVLRLERVVLAYALPIAIVMVRAYLESGVTTAKAIQVGLIQLVPILVIGGWTIV